MVIQNSLNFESSVCSTLCDRSYGFVSEFSTSHCYDPPAPRLVCIETNPGPRSRRNNKNKSNTGNSTSVVALLKQIQQNTTTAVAQINPDTVVFPLLKRVRPYSVILSFQSYHVSSTIVATSFAQDFALSMLHGYGDYTQAFDKYRILEVQTEFFPNTIGLSVTSSAIIDTVIDYDDSTTLTSGEQYQYDSCYSVGSGTSFKRTFVPRISLAAFSGSFTSYAEGKIGQWIDCASDGVKHYGLKGLISASTPNFALNMVHRVHVQFSNQH